MTMHNSATALIDAHEASLDGLDFLGKITWFSVKALTVDHAFLAATAAALGLSAYCPPLPADSDAWRRVTKAAHDTRIDAGNGVLNKILVRDLPKTDADRIVRRLVIETSDPDAGQGKELDYADANGTVGAYDLIFTKSTGQFDAVRSDITADSVADDVVQDIQDAYAFERGKVNADGVRSMVTSALKDNKAITVRPTGGVMFLPRGYTDVLDRLVQIGDAVPECSVRFHTLLNEPGQPDMVAEALTNETINQADQLSTDLAELIRGGAISERRLTTLVGNFMALKERLVTYRDLLDDDLDGVKIRLEQLNNQMGQAARQVV